jgi:hypothetical protein
MCTNSLETAGSEITRCSEEAARRGESGLISPPIADQKGATKRRLALLLAASICIKQRVMKIGLDQFDLHACIQTGPFT